MKIENHRLIASEGFAPEFDLDEQGGILVPEIAVIHYSVTASAGATAAVLEARDFVSCHLSIDQTGRIIQQVPFNRVAWHAGKSEYRGRSNCNAFALGIEIANPGPLEKAADGTFRTTYGAIWRGEVVKAWHKNDDEHRGWRYWAAYSDVDFDLCAHLCALWRDTYGISDIVGHDEIAPGRKTDPGPAFPIDALREAVFPGQHTKTDPAPPLSEGPESAREGST
jgi:N-acetylmuramoyl-L-alanine amidase